MLSEPRGKQPTNEQMTEPVNNQPGLRRHVFTNTAQCGILLLRTRNNLLIIKTNTRGSVVTSAARYSTFLAKKLTNARTRTATALLVPPPTQQDVRRQITRLLAAVLSRRAELLCDEARCWCDKVTQHAGGISVQAKSGRKACVHPHLPYISHTLHGTGVNQLTTRAER